MRLNEEFALSDNFDLAGAGHVLGWLATRAACRSRAWITVWAIVILAVTTTAVICHAPTIAYVILLVVAVVVLFADGPSDKAAV